MRAIRLFSAATVAIVIAGILSDGRPRAYQQTYGIGGVGFVVTTPPRTFLTVGAQHRQDGMGRGHAMFSLLPGSSFSARLFQVERLVAPPSELVGVEGFDGTIWCIAGTDMDTPIVNHIFFISDNGDGDTLATSDYFVHATGANCASAVIPVPPVVFPVSQGDFKAH